MSNITSTLGACFQPGSYMIVTELLPRGSLYELLKDEKVQLSFKRRMKMVCACACVYGYKFESGPRRLLSMVYRQRTLLLE